MKVTIFYYRSCEDHFYAQYGVEAGLKKYRNITFPLRDEGVNFTSEDVRVQTDHVKVAELDIPEQIQNATAEAIAEYCFMAMNNFVLNPLSAGYGLRDFYGADFDELSEEEQSKRRRQNFNNTHGQGTSHTSMSVGDVVEINNELYAVASFGFTKL